MLPEALRAAIDRELEGVSLQQLTQAAAQLSQTYRSGKPTSSVKSILAYLVTRLPATYAALSAVFSELLERWPSFVPKSLLDLGAGPGTASWAVCAHFESCQQFTPVEREEEMIRVGEQLASEHSSLRLAQWRRGDLLSGLDVDPHDLVVLSYAIGELAPDAIPAVIDKAWVAAKEVLVIIEPGTPAGFERIRKVRDQLIVAGGHLVAPCPHHVECPMKGGDWCHFSQRLERTPFHRLAKAGALGYEDEKYSYVIVSKTPLIRPQARVLRSPQRHSGHIDLVLCTERGLVREKVTRKEGERYKRARKVEWGEGWETHFDH
jgi:ribosomal protein RSM22 (predicted rRNA methylase)